MDGFSQGQPGNRGARRPWVEGMLGQMAVVEETQGHPGPAPYPDPPRTQIRCVKILSTETSGLPAQLELEVSGTSAAFFKGGEEHLIVTSTLKQKPES